MAFLRLPFVTMSLLVGACVPSGHLTGERSPVPTFDPFAFFAGHTRGLGTLKVMTRRRQTVVVDGHGEPGRDGSIVLEQDVRQGDRPAKRRTWHLYRAASGRLSGTLTDASGPVTGELAGNTLHLEFSMKAGLRVQQWLYLQPGGQVSHNRMVVAKFGVPVAVLDETITRVSE